MSGHKTVSGLRCSKLMSLGFVGVFLGVVVNLAATRAAGERTFATLQRACTTFLGRSPRLAGVIRRDDRVRDAIRRQTLMLTRHPASPAAADVEAAASSLLAA